MKDISNNNSITEEQLRDALMVIDAYRKDHHNQDDVSLKDMLEKYTTHLGESEDQLVAAVMKGLEQKELNFDPMKGESDNTYLEAISNIFSTLKYRWAVDVDSDVYLKTYAPGYDDIKKEIERNLHRVYQEGFKHLYNDMFQIYYKYDIKDEAEKAVEHFLYDNPGYEYTLETGRFRYKYIIYQCGSNEDGKFTNCECMEGLTVDFVPVQAMELTTHPADIKDIQAKLKVDKDKRRQRESYQWGTIGDTISSISWDSPTD